MAHPSIAEHGYFTQDITAADADGIPVTVNVSASPGDDHRLILDIHGHDGRAGELVEILTVDADQVDALIEALQGARAYLRGEEAAGAEDALTDFARAHDEHRRVMAPIVVSSNHATEYKYECVCSWGSTWHPSEIDARREHAEHQRDQVRQAVAARGVKA